MNHDEAYMRRALELARHGELDASPNPMVGCVIVDGAGAIAGEGWHRKCGQGHAEVNAVERLRARGWKRGERFTVYVTLEPCAHQGRTPPCADMLCSLDRQMRAEGAGLERVVVGCVDPFEKVAGKGIERLRHAGVRVDIMEGDVAGECRRLNGKFFRACRGDRPYVTLKWAQDACGNMGGHFSTPATQTLVHRERCLHDAIMVGSQTALDDRPRLDARCYLGRSPLRVVADRRGRLGAPTPADLGEHLRQLRERGVTSLLVEGGSRLLASFIDRGLWDTARVEVNPRVAARGPVAPSPGLQPVESRQLDGNLVLTYVNPNPA